MKKWNLEVDEKREIYDLSDHCMVRLRLKIKKNKQKKEKDETIEKCRLSQGRMNNYKKEVKDRLTEKEDMSCNNVYLSESSCDLAFGLCIGTPLPSQGVFGLFII